MVSHLKTAWRQIRRTPYQSLSTILVILFTFFILAVFCLVSVGSEVVLRYFESAPQVIAFFEKGKDLDEEEINKIKIELEKTGKLASFKYVSVYEAEAIYREKNKNDPLLLELVDYKILPPSIEITATEIDALPLLKEKIEHHPKVKDIAFYEDIVSSLSAWIKGIRIFGIVLVSYLLMQSFLVIVAIIGMKVMARKEEIEIMRLLGADNWFIRWPFIYEGIFYGSTAAFIAWLFSYILLLYTTPFLVSWLGEIDLLPAPLWFVFLVLIIQLFIGILIGFLGSLMAVHRYLRK